ncbi:MAG: trypsin-like serine protease, partial [Aeromonadaceae bacterium]
MRSRLLVLVLLFTPLTTLAAPRIIGGSDASVAPGWMASLQARSANAQIALGHLCGASLIAADWVMTAAHCVDGAGTVERSVLLGRLSNAVDEANEIAIDQIVLHPE